MAKTGVPFNKNRPYGEIHPTEPREAHDGTVVAASFEQRGLDGKTRMYGPEPEFKRILTKEAPELEEVADAKAAARARSAEAAAKPAARKKDGAPKPKATGRFAQMAGGTNTADTADGTAPPGLSLADWAKGDAEIAFAEVRDRIKAEYDVDVADEDDAAEVLVMNGVVERDDVMVSAGA